MNHIETRRKLQKICGVQEFEKILQQCILTEDEKIILRLHYLDGKSLAYIGDVLGFSECTIKMKHRKILKKLNNFL